MREGEKEDKRKKKTQVFKFFFSKVWETLNNLKEEKMFGLNLRLWLLLGRAVTKVLPWKIPPVQPRSKGKVRRGGRVQVFTYKVNILWKNLQYLIFEDTLKPSPRSPRGSSKTGSQPKSLSTLTWGARGEKTPAPSGSRSMRSWSTFARFHLLFLVYLSRDTKGPKIRAQRPSLPQPCPPSPTHTASLRWSDWTLCWTMTSKSSWWRSTWVLTSAQGSSLKTGPSMSRLKKNI